MRPTAIGWNAEEKDGHTPEKPLKTIGGEFNAISSTRSRVTKASRKLHLISSSHHGSVYLDSNLLATFLLWHLLPFVAA